MILSRSFLARLAPLEAEGRYYVMLDEIQHHLEDGLDEGRWTQEDIFADGELAELVGTPPFTFCECLLSATQPDRPGCQVPQG